MINYKMGSREIGKLRKWAKEHALSPISSKGVCGECKYFDRGYCKRLDKMINRYEDACKYFEYGNPLSIKITIKNNKNADKLYKELYESARKYHLEINHDKKKHEIIVKIFNPPDGFGTKLLERFQKEIDIKVECI